MKVDQSSPPRQRQITHPPQVREWVEYENLLQNVLL